MYGKSYMERVTQITICEIDSQGEFAVWLRNKGALYWPRGLGWGGGSCELPGCLQPERVIWTEIPWHHPSCRPSWSCPHFSSLVSTYCPCPCAGLPVTRMQPRDILIHVAEVQQRRVNLLVFRSRFNCDKALSLGNSLPAGGEASLPFSLKEVVLEFLFGDQKKQVTEAEVRSSPAEESGLWAFIVSTGDTLK